MQYPQMRHNRLICLRYEWLTNGLAERHWLTSWAAMRGPLQPCCLSLVNYLADATIAHTLLVRSNGMQDINTI